jgi:hypothetical protein
LDPQLSLVGVACASRKERKEIIYLLCSRLVLTFIEADAVVFSDSITPPSAMRASIAAQA